MKNGDVPIRGLTASESAFLDTHSGTRPNPKALMSARVRAKNEAADDLRDALTVVAEFVKVFEASGC